MTSCDEISTGRVEMRLAGVIEKVKEEIKK